MSSVFLNSAAPARGKVPVLKALEPRGAQQGKVFTLKLKGEGLNSASEVITSIPGAFTRLAPPADTRVPESELPFLIQLRADAPVGLYPIRVRTVEGLSNVLLFSVGKFPEVIESESLSNESPDREHEKSRNDSMAAAQKVTPPVTINGTLEGPDQDYYRFNARAGQRLVFEVEARRAGSAIDPVIQVLDESGHELARNDDASGLGVDARVEVLFPKAGDYYVLVHDAKYSEQKENFYRLTIGSYLFADGIFPLGWQRGAAVEVSLVGGNLKAPVKVKPNLRVPPSIQFVPVALPGGASLPFQFRLGNFPETLEPAEVPPGGSEPSRSTLYTLRPSIVVNGRIGRAAEVDKYQLKVSPGEHWVIELEAADLGTSQLLGLLSVSDAETGKRLGRAEPGEKESEESIVTGSHSAVDPHLSFTVPEKVTEVIVAVQDLLGRGGPGYGYRLLASRQGYDFSLEALTPFVNIPANGTAAVAFAVTRRGYKGPIRLTVPNLPEGIVQEGGNIPAEPFPPSFANPGYVTLTAKPGAEPQTFELHIWGEAGSTDSSFRREVSAPGISTTIEGTNEQPFIAAWVGSGLPGAVAKPLPGSIEVPVRHFRLTQGSGTQIPWKLKSDAPTQPRFEVKLRGAAACGGTFLRDLHALLKPRGSEYPNEGVFQVVSSLATPPVTFDFVLDAIIHEEGNGERVLTAPAITIEIVPLYALRLASETAHIKRGGKLELSGRVEREPGFTGAIKVAAGDLPEHVTCPEITVLSDQNEFRFVCQADPEAKPGEFEIHMISSATVREKGNQDYRGPETKAKLRVLPET